MEIIPGIDKTLEKKLKDYSDEKRIAFYKKNIPSALEYIGADSKAIKETVHWLQQAARSKTAHQKIKTVMELLRSPYLEVRQTALLFLGSEKQLVESLKPEDVRWLCRDIDNWVLADTLSVMILGVMWRTGILGPDFFRLLAVSPNVWDRRLSLVSTVALNLKSRGGKGDIPNTLSICTMHVSDHRPMVAKALSWALRELSKRDKNVVTGFLETHRNSMVAFAVREISSKLTTGVKTNRKPKTA